MAETSDVIAFDQSTDAAWWAKAFCERFIVSTPEGVVEDSEGLMIAWFANAIERGRAASQEKMERMEKALRQLETWDMLYLDPETGRGAATASNPGPYRVDRTG